MNTQPNKLAGRQPENGEDRDGGIGHHVHERGAHVVIAVCSRASSRHFGGMAVLGERNLVVVRMIVVRKAHTSDELVRFRDFFDRFQIRAAIGEREKLARCVRPLGLEGYRLVTGNGIMTAFEPYAKPRRHPILENFEKKRAVAGIDTPNLLMVSMAVAVCIAMPMAMVMVVVAAQQPGARHVDH